MADQKISALPPIATPAATDQFASVQGGVTSIQTRVQLHTLGAGETLIVGNGLDNAAFSHDGTNFLTDFTNTGSWTITGIDTSVVLSAADLHLASGGKFFLRSDTSSKWVSMDVVGETSLQWGTLGVTSHQFIGLSQFWLRDGATFRISDAGDTDYAEFSHDGANFNTVFTNTGSWIIGSGLTSVAFEQNDMYLRGTGTGVRRMFLGPNVVTGASASDGFLMLIGEDAGTLYGGSIRQSSSSMLIAGALDGAATVAATVLAIALETQVSGGNDLVVRDGGAFRIQDALDTDWAEFSHNGSNFNTVFTNTSNWDISGLTAQMRISTGLHMMSGNAMRWWGAGGANAVTVNHNDTDFVWTTSAAQTGDFSLIGFGGNLRLRDGIGLQIMDLGDTDSATFNHDGTDFNTTFANTTDWNINGANVVIDQTAVSTDSILTLGPKVSNISARTGALEIYGEQANTIYGMRIDTTSNVGRIDGVGANPILSLTLDVGTINFSAGATTQWFDGTGTDSTSMQQFIDRFQVTVDPGDRFAISSTVGVQVGGGGYLQVTAGGDLDVRDGGSLFIRDALDTDWVEMSHNGTQFLFDFVNTSSVNFEGMTGFNFLNMGGTFTVEADLIQMFAKQEGAATGLSELRIGNGVAQGSNSNDGKIVIFGEHNAATYGFQMSVASGNVGFSGTASGADFAATALQMSMNFQMTGGNDFTMIGGGAFRCNDGSTLQIRDATNIDDALFSHDGTDFNTALTGTTDWNITGANLKLDGALNADAWVAAGVRSATVFETRLTPGGGVEFYSGISAGGWSRGFIPKKNSTGAINAGIGFLGSAESVTSAHIGFGTSWISTGSAMSFTTSMVSVDNGGIFRVMDSGETDWADFSHDSTDFNTAFTNTTDWNITGLTGYVKVDAVGIHLWGNLPAATPPTTEAMNFQISLYDSDGTDRVASMGFQGSSQFRIDNEMWGQAVELGARDALGARKVCLSGSATGASNLFYAGTLTMRTEAGGVALWAGDSLETTASQVRFVHANGTLRSSFGMNGSGDFEVFNSQDGYNVVIKARNATATIKTLATFDPDTEQMILPSFNDAVTPTLAFGDGDTGFYESADDALRVAITGVAKWQIDGSFFGSEAIGGATTRQNASTAAIPGHTFKNDTDSGIGQDGADTVVVTVGALVAAKFSEVATVLQMVLPLQNNQSSPSLAFGDGNTGFYEQSDNVLSLSIAGGLKYLFDSSSIRTDKTNSAEIRYVDPTATVPGFTFQGDADTGIGWAGADALSIVAGAVESLRITEASAGVLFSYEANVGLTADVSSIQGGGVITSSHNVYSTVANAGDAATLPATFPVGTKVFIKNDGANSMDVFPALGDNAGAGTDVAVAVANGVGALFIATVANSTWTQMF